MATAPETLRFQAPLDERGEQGGGYTRCHNYVPIDFHWKIPCCLLERSGNPALAGQQGYQIIPSPLVGEGQGEGGKIRSRFDTLQLVGAKRKSRFGGAARRFIIPFRHAGPDPASRVILDKLDAGSKKLAPDSIRGPAWRYGHMKW